MSQQSYVTAECMSQQSYYVTAECMSQQSYYVTAESMSQQSYYVTAELVIQQSYYVTYFGQSIWCPLETFTEFTDPRLQQHDWSNLCDFEELRDTGHSRQEPLVDLKTVFALTSLHLEEFLWKTKQTIVVSTTATRVSFPLNPVGEE